MAQKIVEIDHVSMMFNKSIERVDNIKEYFIRLVKRQLLFEEFWALQDISLQLEGGESLGIIGLNGSGKSTLLKIIAGVMKPTRGRVSVMGTVSPLIELGAGFDYELTARENIFLNGAILGYSKKLLVSKFEEIVDFAELLDFLDTPIKNFSSGMVARLGFSLATIIKPDLLIVDEILSVGDFHFQEKCEDRIAYLISGGTSVILVSHSIDQVQKVCKKTLWIDKGKKMMLDVTEKVMLDYQQS